MNAAPAVAVPARSWQVTLALCLVYLSWGTTYFATQEAMRTMPPAMFGGCRIALAGLLLLGFLGLRGRLVRPGPGDLFRVWVVGCVMFLAGNGLINVAQKSVPSGIASVLVATTPLWLALLETVLPHGERLPLRCWLGLVAGMLGVIVLWVGKPSGPAEIASVWGPLLVLGSAFAWAAGSVVHRHLRVRTPLMQTAALQMLLGGGTQALVGYALGEADGITSAHLTPVIVGAFFYLLVVGSLVGFVAYVWLLEHVSAALAGTYAYVNPVVALVVGWLLANEPLTAPIVLGMVVILGGVALVRSSRAAVQPPEAARGEPLLQLSPKNEETVAFCLDSSNNR